MKKRNVSKVEIDQVIIKSSLTLPCHGTAPVRTCHESTPKLYTSALGLVMAPPLLLLMNSSGAMYCCVPRPPAELEKDVAFEDVARPKSVIHGVPSNAKNVASVATKKGPPKTAEERGIAIEVCR